MAFIRLQYEPIDVADCYKKMKAPTFGGIVTFCGTVREWTGQMQTTYVEYTAYEEMALAHQDEVKDKKPTWRHMSQIGG